MHCHNVTLFPLNFLISMNRNFVHQSLYEIVIHPTIPGGRKRESLIFFFGEQTSQLNSFLMLYPCTNHHLLVHHMLNRSSNNLFTSDDMIFDDPFTSNSIIAVLFDCYARILMIFVPSFTARRVKAWSYLWKESSFM